MSDANEKWGERYEKAGKETAERLKELEADGRLDPEELAAISMQIIKDDSDFFPMINAIDRLGLWDMWHEAIDLANDVEGDDPDIDYSYAMSKTEEFYKTSKQAIKTLDTLLGDGEGLFKHTVKSDPKDQISLAFAVLLSDQKKDFLFTVDCAKEFVRDLATAYGGDKADSKRIKVACQLLDNYNLLIERLENGLPVPPTRDEMHEWFMKHDGYDYITYGGRGMNDDNDKVDMSEVEKVAAEDNGPTEMNLFGKHISNSKPTVFSGTLDDMMTSLEKKSSDEITAPEILSTFLASYTHKDSPEKLYDLLELIDKKDVWDTWDEAADLITEAEITDPSGLGDAPTGKEIASSMNIVYQAYSLIKTEDKLKKVLALSPKELLHFLMNSTPDDRIDLVSGSVALGYDEEVISHLGQLIDLLENNKKEALDDLKMTDDAFDFLTASLSGFRQAVINSRTKSDRQQEQENKDNRLKGLLGI